MLLKELRSPTGKPYPSIHRPDSASWIYAAWTGYPTATNVSTGALAYQQEKLPSVLNGNRHLVGRWAHLYNAGAMSVTSATGLHQFISSQFEVELFTD